MEHTAEPASAPSDRVPGVRWHQQSSKWVAKLSHGGKRHYVGYFAEERDAIDAIRAAREAAAAAVAAQCALFGELTQLFLQPGLALVSAGIPQTLR